MGSIRHLVLAKFKAEAAVEELLQGLQKLVSGIDGRGRAQGFTHAFLLTFGSAEDLATYIKHPSHVEYGKAFRAAIDKILAIDFPVVTGEIGARSQNYAMISSQAYIYAVMEVSSLPYCCLAVYQRLRIDTDVINRKVNT
ncbi:hypothetical protein GW17_00006045 [Ensete ventricosum]|nr:hypothetical protein GW17_00006045 [Ensete ventricosum]RZR93434.1 hypothetical protein BHM03_00021976 [Ensete ventricosum]